jgi:histidine triad (HIT) family protein
MYAPLIARAMKLAFGCDGLMIMQSNEPAGNQTVWHYHLHVIPRFRDDQYLRRLGQLGQSYQLMPADERAAYAGRLRPHIAD